MKKLLLIFLMLPGLVQGIEKTQATPEQAQKLSAELIEQLYMLTSGNIEAAQIKQIEDLIAQGADVNTPYNNETPFTVALRTNNPQIVKRLLDSGANVNKKNKEGSNALNYYSMLNFPNNPNITIVKLLIENGVDINNIDNHRITPLELAAYYGHPEIVRLLIQGGSQAGTSKLRHLKSSEKEKSYFGWLPSELMELTERYTNQADPNITNIVGQTPLTIAINQLENILMNPRLRYDSNSAQKIKDYEEIINLLEPITTKK